MCILLLCGSHHNHWHLNNFRKSTFHARILWSHHSFANQCQHTGAYIVVISWRLSNQMHVAHAISKATLIISLNTSYKDIFASQIWLNYIKCSEFALLAHTHAHTCQHQSCHINLRRLLIIVYINCTSVNATFCASAWLPHVSSPRKMCQQPLAVAAAASNIVKI